jgi:hypothetical protein
MAVLLYTNTSLIMCEEGIIVCPICTQLKMMVNYPINEVRKIDVLAYSHLMGFIEENGIEEGQLVLSETNTDEPILWFPMHKMYNTRYRIDWIESGLKTLSEHRLHDKYPIYFPAIGYYDSDRIDVKLVHKAVKKYLGDGLKPVDFVLNY